MDSLIIGIVANEQNIDNKSYAKLLFIVGQEHDNYKENLELANTLNNLVKEKYPSLTRGVMLKSGENVNGKYNQDLSNKMILIEVDILAPCRDVLYCSNIHKLFIAIISVTEYTLN